MPDPTFDMVGDFDGEIIHGEKQDVLVAEMVNTHIMEDPSVRGGVCKALCAKWIANSVNGDDFWETLHDPTTRETIRQLQHKEQAAAKLVSAALDTADKSGRFDRNQTNQMMFAVKLMGAMDPNLAKKSQDLQLAQTEGEKLKDTWASQYITKATGLAAPGLTPVQPDDLVRQLVQQKGYYLFGIEFAGGGGHAMALYNVPGIGVQYFDPNCGEVIFTDSAKFQNWMTQHLGNYSSMFGAISASKLTVVDAKTAPNRRDMQPWVNEHAGPVKPQVPLPIHWPALESATAIQREKQRIKDEQNAQREAAAMLHFQAQYQNVGSGRDALRKPKVRGNGAPNGVPNNNNNNNQPLVNHNGPPNPVPPVIPQVVPQPNPQPVVQGGANNKKSWRNGRMLTANDVANLNGTD